MTRDEWTEHVKHYCIDASNKAVTKRVADKLRRKSEVDFEIDYTTKAIKYTGKKTQASVLELYRYLQEQYKDE